jgi:hypothetical protein
MAIRYQTRQFLALVDGAFDDQGAWRIEAAVVLRTPTDPARRDALADEARRAVLRGVAEETRRGRSLGAHTIRISDSPVVCGTDRPEILGS